MRAGRDATSLSAFYRKSLGVIGRFFASPYAALHLQLASEVIQEETHVGPTDPGFWKPTVQAFLTESLAEPRSRAQLLNSRKAALRLALIAVPIHDQDGRMIGAVALITRATDPDARQLVALLESIAALVSYAAGTVGMQRESAQRASSGGQATQQLARAAAVESIEELAYSLTNGLRNKMGCDHVALGLVRGKHVKIVSISGFDDIKPRSPGVVTIRSAMEECVDAGEPVAYNADSESDASTRRYLLHKRWHESAHGASVASIPLRSGTETVAVLSLRRSGNDPFNAENIEEIRKLVEPFAPAIELVIKARRSVVGHARDNVVGAVRSLFRPGRLGRKIAVGVVVAFALWFFFGTLNYEVSTPCTVTPAHVRQMAMPFAGVLAESRVIAGDRVRAGDVLCVVDDRDLQIQRQQLAAELDVIIREHDMAMADQKPVDARLALAREQLTRAKLAAVERKIEQATIRSPLDGLVIQGDLRMQVGAVLEQGKMLFEVAPLDEWVVEFEVPEHAVEELKAGQTGRFASQARPETAYDVKLVRIDPTSELRKNRNVYIAEADINAPGYWMRPGMEGVGRIEVGPRRVCWVALHRMFDYLYLNWLL